MLRTLVIKPAVVDAAAAAWIAANVLVRPRKNGKLRWAGPDLGEQVGVVNNICQCQYGVCGVCKDLKRHDQCAHRTGRSPASDGHETWLISARPEHPALTGVWIKQVFDRVWPACNWVCSCEECARIGPVLPGFGHIPAARRRPLDGVEQPSLF